MLILRSFVFNVLFYLALVAIMIAGLPVLAMGPARVKAVARLWGRVSLWLLRVVCGTHVEFRGMEHIPQGACLIAPKHQSMWEVFALITVFKDFTYVFKRELTWIPLFGWYLGLSGQIAVDRAKGRAALIQVARKARVLLAGNRQMFIFPEGTRRQPGAPPDYKYGAAFMYTQNGVPCLPVALNSGLFWPRRRFIRRPGTIVVDILPLIPPGLGAADFLKELERRVEAASDRLVAEALARDPGLRVALYRPAEDSAAAA